jgi:hypothetical protein
LWERPTFVISLFPLSRFEKRKKKKKKKKKERKKKKKLIELDGYPKFSIFLVSKAKNKVFS